MDKKDKRKYEKAIKYCEKGKIEKALEVCEEGIAGNLGASELLNLKGLLLYQKGMLKEASTVWKLNSVVNSNAEAKAYANGCEADKDKLVLYKEADSYLKDGNVDKALALFINCTKSDFNCIKTNTKIAFCYEKKAYYYKAMEFVEKALKVDADNYEAKRLKDELLIRLKEEYNNDYTSKTKLLLPTALVLIIAVFIGGYSIKSKITASKLDGKAQGQAEIIVENDENVESNNINEENAESNKSDENVESVKKEENNDKTQSIDYLIENKDYNNLYSKLENTNLDEVSKSEKEKYNKGIELLKSEGVEEFYKSGSALYNEKKYDEARKEFDKAYKYCADSYLKSHVIFYRGTVASEQGEKDVTEKMYEEYAKENPKGSYIEGVLYELALLNDKNGNKDNAYKYADELAYNYPDSIYLNTKLMNIINN